MYCMVAQGCPSQSPQLPHEDTVLCTALGSGLSLRLGAGFVLVPSWGRRGFANKMLTWDPSISLAAILRTMLWSDLQMSPPSPPFTGVRPVQGLQFLPATTSFPLYPLKSISPSEFFACLKLCWWLIPCRPKITQWAKESGGVIILFGEMLSLRSHQDLLLKYKQTWKS